MTSGFGMGPIPDRSSTRPEPQQPDPTHQPRSALLRLLNGPRAGTEFALDKAEQTVGRSDPPQFEADIDLTDCELGAPPVVSRRHALLRWVEQALYLQDLGSTNGTRVNSAALRGAQPREVSEFKQLHSNDRLVFANLEFEVIING